VLTFEIETAECAKQLHEEWQAWLDGSDLKELGATSNSKILKERTLTNLYNALSVLRAQPEATDLKLGRIPNDAKTFATRLKVLHDALDSAVCEAYGWDVSILGDEDALLNQLLLLNQKRSN
jgi:hypothetical protein